MIYVSGSTSHVDNHIIDTNRMDLNNITSGSYYSCKYDDLYFCIANYVSMEPSDANVKFMLPRHLLTSFFGLIMRMSAGFS